MPHTHPNARINPAVRAEIARSTEPRGTVARRCVISAETVRKWRKRGAGDCLDRSARPCRLPGRSVLQEAEQARLVAEAANEVPQPNS